MWLCSHYHVVWKPVWTERVSGSQFSPWRTTFSPLRRSNPYVSHRLVCSLVVQGTTLEEVDGESFLFPLFNTHADVWQRRSGFCKQLKQYETKTINPSQKLGGCRCFSLASASPSAGVVSGLRGGAGGGCFPNSILVHPKSCPQPAVARGYQSRRLWDALLQLFGFVPRSSSAFHFFQAPPSNFTADAIKPADLGKIRKLSSAVRMGVIPV